MVMQTTSGTTTASGTSGSASTVAPIRDKWGCDLNNPNDMAAEAIITFLQTNISATLFGWDPYPSLQYYCLNVSGLITQIITGIGLALYGFAMSGASLVWSLLPSDWRLIIIGVDTFDPDAPYYVDPKKIQADPAPKPASG